MEPFDSNQLALKLRAVEDLRMQFVSTLLIPPLRWPSEINIEPFNSNQAFSTHRLAVHPRILLPRERVFENREVGQIGIVVLVKIVTGAADTRECMIQSSHRARFKRR